MDKALSKDIEYIIKHLPPDTASVNLRLSGDSENLALVRRVIDASLNHLSISAALLNDLKLATT